MSTDLYGVRILKNDKRARKMTLRVFVVYYDTAYKYHQPIPDDASFFVRLLCDKDALGDDIDESRRFDEDYIDRNAFRFIDKVKLTHQKNFPLEEKDYENYSDFYYERDGGWVDEEKLVQADFEVTVAKEEYLEPFLVGASWGTTSYPTMADKLTRAQYAEIPDFGEGKAFTPFPGAVSEASITERMVFDSTGEKLLVTNQDGGIRIFSTADYSVLVDVPDAGEMFSQANWDKDGNVVVSGEESSHRLNVETGEKEPCDFGFCVNSKGTRMLADKYPARVTIKDENQNVLFDEDHGHGEGTAVAISFADDDHTFAEAIEGTSLRIRNLDGDIVKELPFNDFPYDIALSPDAKYLLAISFRALEVIDVETGTILRRIEKQGKVGANVAWSPDGKSCVMTWGNHNGYEAIGSVHPIGSVVEALEKAPVEKPTADEVTLQTVVELYVEQTATFSNGWRSHLDDDLIDFHVTLAGLGFDLDLTDHMNGDPTIIAALAYESIVRRKRGDTEKADQALNRALEQADISDIQDWGATFTFAPLAAAVALSGDSQKADELFEKSLVEIDNEANPFQKKQVLCRSYLLAERFEPLEEILDEYETSWVSDSFNYPLIGDLAEANQLKLIRLVYKNWNLEDEHEGQTKVFAALSKHGLFEHIVDPSWLDDDFEVDEGALLDAWLGWFESDESSAKAALQKRAAENPDDEIIAFVNAARGESFSEEALTKSSLTSWTAIAILIHAKHPKGKMKWDGYNDWQKSMVAEQLFGIGGSFPESFNYGVGSEASDGDWDAVYAKINATKKTKRTELYKQALDAALGRGDLFVVVDALRQMPCTDMNSDGLRALQKAVKAIAGAGYRRVHP